ncbi:MAG TPA: hypothetical protein VM241_07430 [Candidatus Thermoplasmatota archaeon]|nr:hypothetical protein [Candidatus Thermoplasmatota archaeon]
MAPPPAAPATPPAAAPAPPTRPAPATPPAASAPGAPRADGQGEPDVGNRLNKIETALASIQDLRGLSELLSVQYNPFLEAEEASPEARHTASEFVRRLGVPNNLDADAAAPPTAPTPEPEAAPLPAAPAPHANGVAKERTPFPPVAAAAPANGGAPVLHEPAASPHDASLYGRGLFSPSRPIGGPRESFLAIHWFTYLAEGTDPSVIFVYLDYYRAAGWFGDAEFSWLESLAHGLARRRPGAAWSDYGLDARRLAHSHLRNLRVLDKLFGATLQHGEAQYLQQTLDALLQEA